MLVEWVEYLAAQHGGSVAGLLEAELGVKERTIYAVSAEQSLVFFAKAVGSVQYMRWLWSMDEEGDVLRRPPLLTIVESLRFDLAVGRDRNAAAGLLLGILAELGRSWGGVWRVTSQVVRARFEEVWVFVLDINKTEDRHLHREIVILHTNRMSVVVNVWKEVL